MGYVKTSSLKYMRENLDKLPLELKNYYTDMSNTVNTRQRIDRVLTLFVAKPTLSVWLSPVAANDNVGEDFYVLATTCSTHASNLGGLLLLTVLMKDLTL